MHSMWPDFVVTLKMLVVTLKKVPADQLVNEQNLIAMYIFVIGRSHCDYGMNRTSSTFHLYQCSVKAASIAAGKLHS